MVYKFFSCSTNIPRGLSAYKPQKLVVYCLMIPKINFRKWWTLAIFQVKILASLTLILSLRFSFLSLVSSFCRNKLSSLSAFRLLSGWKYNCFHGIITGFSSRPEEKYKLQYLQWFEFQASEETFTLLFESKLSFEELYLPTFPVIRILSPWLISKSRSYKTQKTPPQRSE